MEMEVVGPGVETESLLLYTVQKGNDSFIYVQFVLSYYGEVD